MTALIGAALLRHLESAIERGVIAREQGCKEEAHVLMMLSLYGLWGVCVTLSPSRRENAFWRAFYGKIMGFCIGKNEKNWRIEGNFRDGEKIAFYKVHIEEPIVFESLHECPFNLTRLGLLSKSFSTYQIYWYTRV